MNSLGKGDSIRIETNLNKLQKEKQLLNDLLKNIKIKVKEKVKELETKKSEINRLITDKNNLFEQLNHLRDQSIAVEENAKRIERNINERRNCFQQLKQEFNERRKQQSIIM
jgi:phage shock protein A